MSKEHVNSVLVSNYFSYTYYTLDITCSCQHQMCRFVIKPHPLQHAMVTDQPFYILELPFNGFPSFSVDFKANPDDSTQEQKSLVTRFYGAGEVHSLFHFKSMQLQM